MNLHEGKEWKLLLLGTVFVLCVLPVLYITVFMRVDGFFCHRRMENRLGDRTDEVSLGKALLEYIESSAKEGMSRDDVIKEIEKIAPVELRRRFPEVDTLAIGGCLSPVNDYIIYIGYYEDGTFRKINGTDSW
jgi:hypothetical protein